MVDRSHGSSPVTPSMGPTKLGWGDAPDELPDSSRSPWRAWRLRWVLYFASVVVALLVGTVLARPRRPPSLQRVLPGEFERHDLLLIAWPTTLKNRKMPIPALQGMVAEIARAVEGSIDIAVLTTDEARRQAAGNFLSAAGVNSDRVRFLSVPSHTIWVRDYGPFVVKSFEGGGCETLNTVYRHAASNALNDVPLALHEPLGWPLVDVPILMQNGNLLSNGAGLCVTSEQLFADNTRDGKSRLDVVNQFRDYFGAEQVVSQENLIGEPTGHVDVFMTFTAPDTVVVGAYPPAYDPENAAILDRNAERLSGLRTACGPLQVHRIPMPPRPDGRWRTFANVVLANGVLLVPSYGPSFQEEEAQSLAVYKHLLPNWKIVSIDCTALVQGDGGLHCMTMNVYRAAGDHPSPSPAAPVQAAQDKPMLTAP